MKNRPQPKKISFIKVNNNKNSNKSNNKNINKYKKQINAQNNNLLIINSPKNNFISSSNKYNEKLFNKIQRYSLEAHLLNQVMSNSTQNRNKDNNNFNLKYTRENNDMSTNTKKKNIDELRYNSLDNKNSMQKLKRRNNTNKLYTDRCTNPFIKNQNSINKNKNDHINITSNENSIKRNNIKNSRSLRFKNINKKPHSLSKERKSNNIIDTNFKYTKPKITKKTYNIKRNISANNRMIGHKKINGNYSNKENIRRENEEEFNINYLDENDNLLFDIHTSYNLTTKNPFNFYYTDIQFRSSKNMLEKNSKNDKNKKINFGIKEENETEDNNNNNNLEFSFRKNQNINNNIDNDNEVINSSINKNSFEINTLNINEIKFNGNKKFNKKENTLKSLNKRGINLCNSNNDVLSNSKFKVWNTPEKLEYSLERKRKVMNLKNKDKNINKYYILKNNGIFYNKKLNNNYEIDNNKLIEKFKNLNNYHNIIYEKRNKMGYIENSFSNKRKHNNKSKMNNSKSPTINNFNKFNNSNYNYQNHKLYFINSPKMKNENSYDSTLKRNNRIKFNKFNKEIEKEKSYSKSKSKSRAKSHINKNDNSIKYINRINKLIFIIKNNWGNIIKIGLNNIRLVDKNNKNIPIKYSNFDISKPYITKYIKGEVKKLTIGYDKNYNLKNIVILNGFNDTGVKYLIVENDRGKILWKGNIPKINMINIKEFFISFDNNYSHNMPTNNLKKSQNFSKTMCLTKDDNNYFNNYKHTSNTLKINQNNENLDNTNKTYELCDRIKIKLISNYGNRDFIGLSGIEFYDNNNKLINIIEIKKTIRINENIVNLKEKKILYNLFNNKNDTIDPQYMFLTTYCNAFINIEFKHSIKISKIIFYNYNNNYYKDCATKGILIYFYLNKKSNKINKPIYLYLPPGEENIDYGQTLLYPFDNNIFFEKKIKESKIYLRLNPFKMVYNDEYKYYCPFLPFGYILKIEMISNYGDKNYIGINNIQLFDEDNNEINLEFSSIKPKTEEYKFKDYSNDSNSFNIINISNNINENLNPRIYMMPGAKKINPNNRPIFLSKFHNFNHANNELGENRIYFIFSECITLSRICVHNYNKSLDIAVKDIKILLDDNIIFEGELKNKENNNIYFCDKKFFDNNGLVKIISHTTTSSKGKDKKYNGMDKNMTVLGKTFEYKKNKINYKFNDDKYERYIEYEEKNGTKILKLNEI